VRDVPAVSEFLDYLVPGLTIGSIYAIIALGLVITYKTTGIFNFAHGGLAATAAYMFHQFRVEQGLPWGWAFLFSLLLVGVLGGLIMERLAALLAQAPTVMVVVATVGLLVLLQSLMTAIYGAATLRDEPYLPSGGFRLGHVLVTGADIIQIGVALAAAIGLTYYFARTRSGKAMTAIVDDPALLSLQKTNPTFVRRQAWLLGSCFAAVSGMFLAPVLGISVNTMILLVIAAYGAAAVGRFENLPLTIGGAVVIGLLVSYLPSQTRTAGSVFISTLPQNIPFIVLFLVFVFTPARLLTARGVRNVRRMRPMREFPRRVTVPGLGLLLAAGLAGPLLIPETDILQYASGFGYAMIFASLGMLVWMSGQISLCQMSFAAVGAAITGHMLAHGQSWPVAVLIAGLVAVPFGAVVAIPAIRLSGIYVAVATFGFGIVVQTVFFPSDLLFGQTTNSVEVPRPVILGINFTTPKGYYYLALMSLAFVLAVVLLVRRSQLGKLLRAMSDSPVALDAHGANTTVTRVTVFCLAAFLAALGGATIAGVPEQASGLVGGTYSFTVSLVLIPLLAVCGRRPVLSPLLAAAAYQVIRIYPPFDSRTYIDYQGVLFGAAAILAAVWPALNLRAVLGKRANERRGPARLRARIDELPNASAGLAQTATEKPTLVGAGRSWS